MATAYKHMGLGSPKQVMEYTDQRIAEIERRLEDLGNELEMWKQIKASYRPCKGCNGRGEIVCQLSHDEARYEKCKPCNGSGVSKVA